MRPGPPNPAKDRYRHVKHDNDNNNTLHRMDLGTHQYHIGTSRIQQGTDS